MTPKRFYQLHSREEIQSLCERSKTTFSNFQQIALFGGSVSSKLAKRLAANSDDKMTRDEILFPEEYSNAE